MFPLKMVCGCPCGGGNKNSHAHTLLTLWNAFVNVQMHLLGIQLGNVTTTITTRSGRTQLIRSIDLIRCTWHRPYKMKLNEPVRQAYKERDFPHSGRNGANTTICKTLERKATFCLAAVCLGLPNRTRHFIPRLSKSLCPRSDL